jgi:hypothetical protein
MAVLVVVLLLLGGVGYGTSGQGRVGGTVKDEEGQPLPDCKVTRGLRLGVGLGGFDGQAYVTGPMGQFALPVNRGLNRLTFACRGMRKGSATTLVWRGREPRITVVLDMP